MNQYIYIRIYTENASLYDICINRQTFGVRNEIYKQFNNNLHMRDKEEERVH